MTNIDALVNASTANDLFFEACAPFVAHMAQCNTADDYSFEVVIEMVHVDTNGFLVGRHVATLSDINDSCYNTATTIIRTWKLTRNAISS